MSPSAHSLSDTEPHRSIYALSFCELSSSIFIWQDIRERHSLYEVTWQEGVYLLIISTLLLEIIRPCSAVCANSPLLRLNIPPANLIGPSAFLILLRFKKRWSRVPLNFRTRCETTTRMAKHSFSEK